MPHSFKYLCNSAVMITAFPHQSYGVSPSRGKHLVILSDVMTCMHAATADGLSTFPRRCTCERELKRNLLLD